MIKINAECPLSYCGVGEGDRCCLWMVELYVLLLNCMQYRQGQKSE